ncbi:hypothetical protein BC834DRAFT_852429 [Gloeopeniophorella convolvens]|nr:hypothetical protein BC834DRAFT_852429 [Gloeopeniophorella convolvens]
MQSQDQTLSPQPSRPSVDSKRRISRTVLGLSNILHRPDSAHASSDPALSKSPSLDARSSLSTRRRRKLKAQSQSVTDPSFFELDSTVHVENTPPSPIMTASQDIQPRPARRQVLRMDAQDGPWTVSVAENPHDPVSYTLYVKTPTHNLTLSRTAREIVELDHKLHDAYPSVTRPTLPIDPAALPQPAKRKSVFLNTLSRLASPSGKSASARGSAAGAPRPISASPASPVPSSLPTPLVSPRAEIADPFLDDSGEVAVGGLGASTSTNPTITGLAAYLTTLSNDQVFRQARPWKRFVRVRTDDLESVRVERAIKRVRSDIAAHMTSPSTVNITMHNSSVVEDAQRTRQEREPREDAASGKPPGLERRGSRFREDIEEVEETHDEASVQDTDTAPSLVSDDKSTSEGAQGDGAAHDADAESAAPSAKSDAIEIEASEDGSIAAPESPSAPASAAAAAAAATVAATSSPAPAPADSIINGVAQDAAPITPVPLEHPSRIPRSQSADPDKAARLSRVYTQSATSVGASAIETASASASATEDESSVNTSRERRKKRSKSAAPAKDRVSRKVQVSDFEMMRVLGKGCAGKVLLVKHKNSADLYALKAITKRHVLAHQELQHTLTEQAVLRRMAAEGSDPFVVKLWWSFHDKENLFLVMDFHPGGDLATQLARWGRLGRDRARFYAAEIVEGVEGLHTAGVVYRDLKPENILIAADGHIVLTDFGLSKEFPRRAIAPGTPPSAGASPHWMKDDKDIANGPWPPRNADTTSTFCGTAEYLAPEVIQGLPYSYEVDWWSFGTMLYEMLTGITPFWADNHSDMYVRVLQDELQFPDDRAMDQDTKSLLRGLLQRNPALRISEPRIKRHPYFSMIDWAHVYYKRYIPPYIPPIDPSNASDTQNFDDTFLDMEPVINDENDVDTDQERDQTDQEATDGEDSVATPSQSRSSSVHPPPDDGIDVFDGYSFKGRHSVIIDDEEEVSEEEEEEEDVTGDSILAELNGAIAPETVEPATVEVEGQGEHTPEPKTPEARPAALPPPAPPAKQSPVATRPELPPVDTSVKPPAPVADATPRASEDIPTPMTPPSPIKAAAEAAAAASNGPDIHRKEAKKVPAPKTHAQRPSRQRNRREKSGVPALDRDLSDANDDDVRMERDEEDEDWDFIEADGEDRNGARGTSLFARGVVDRYKLAVFRKGSTPNRSTSGISDSTRLSTATTLTNGGGSPTPAQKERRGRTGALPFRRTPKTFLRAKSPPSARSSQSAGKSLISASESTTLSSASSPRTLPHPSLKSKESTVSVGSPGSSSDASTNGDARLDPDVIETVRAPPVDEHEKQKNKKLKRGAEKMLSLFASSPR